MKQITALFLLATLSTVLSAPQWPYRDNMESYYYGYQQDSKPQKSFYRAAEIQDDDESEADFGNVHHKYGARQDLKVGQSSQSDSQGATLPVTTEINKIKVIETGSAKPVPSQQQKPATPTNNKQANQPFAANPQRQPPAFPPATPPNQQQGNRPGNQGNRNPEEESEEDEEDSDEEEEAGDDENNNNDDDQSEENEEEEDSDRRRNEPVAITTQKLSNVTVESVEESMESVEMPKKNVTVSTKDVTKSEPKVVAENKKSKKNKNNQGKQTIEALVPGYITDQGEVLVPFDTVSGNLNNRPGGQISIIPDPTYQDSTLQIRPQTTKKVSKKSKKNGGTPPVVVVGGQKKKVVELEQRSVPQFFRSQQQVPNNQQVYYSSAPPPGSIFTFDDDNEDVVSGNSKLRQDESSEEEEEEDNQDDDNSDESEEEDLGEAPPRPPLGFVKATAPSGEDDEAESLGLRPGTPIQSRSLYDEEFVSFPTSRSPAVFAVQIPFNPAYFGYNSENRRRPTQQQYHYTERPQHYGRPQYERPQNYGRPQYYERPQNYGQNYGRPQQYERPQNYGRPQQSYRPSFSAYIRPHQQQQQNHYGNRPETYYVNKENSYYGNKPSSNQVYYYRPESNKKTKVIPVANFDVSLEHDEESGEVKPVLSPFYYKDVKIAKKNRPVVVRRQQNRPQNRPQNNRPNLVAVYDGENGYSFTPVIRQRSGGFQRLRMPKQLKEAKKSSKKVNKKVEDPLGIFKKEKVVISNKKH